MSKEFRGIANAELRAARGRRIEGYAAIFNELSEDLGGFRELVRPGAFADSLASKRDVTALIDHKSELILGRTRAGTLRLAEDHRGLHFSVSIPNTTYGRDIVESVSRDDVNQASFAFRVQKDAWPSREIRELIAVTLSDISLVTYPAYPQTSASVRGWYAGEYTASVGYRRDPRFDTFGDKWRRIVMAEHARAIELSEQLQRAAANAPVYVSTEEMRDQRRRQIMARNEEICRRDSLYLIAEEKKKRAKPCGPHGRFDCVECWPPQWGTRRGLE